MRSAIWGIAFVLGTASMATQAEEYGRVSALNIVGTMGATYGGDIIYSSVDANGFSSNLRAGSFLQYGIGALWQPRFAPVAVQLTINWHNDDFKYNYFYSSNINNGFNRFPIELVGYLTPAPDFRIGAGKRFIKIPSAYVEANNSTEELHFDNTNGKIFEIGYRVADNAWINLRYVSERYQPYTLTQNGNTVSVAGSPSVNGSHIGINVVLNLWDMSGSSGSAPVSAAAPAALREEERQSGYQSGYRINPLYIAPEPEHHTDSVKREVQLNIHKPDFKEEDSKDKGH